MLHTRKGCLTAWIPPAELGEGTRPCSQGMELGGSVPTCPQPHSDLGVFKRGFDKPSPGGLWAPPGPGRWIHPEGHEPHGGVRVILCFSAAFPRAAGFYWELLATFPRPHLPSAPHALPCLGVPTACWGSCLPFYLPGPGRGGPGEGAIKMFYAGTGWFLCNKSRSRCRAAPV